MPVAAVIGDGSSTSQKRSNSAVASTVKTMRHSAPAAGYQLRRSRAQPTNSSATPAQNVWAGDKGGVPNASRRLM
jgi:hypothetical protein